MPEVPKEVVPEKKVAVPKKPEIPPAKLPEVPEKPVLEEKPAVSIPEKVEPPPEGTHKTINKRATSDFF